MPLAELGADLLFQVIADRAERAAVIVTTNLPFSAARAADAALALRGGSIALRSMGQVFSNPRLCQALVDRLPIARTSSRPAPSHSASDAPSPAVEP